MHGNTKHDLPLDRITTIRLTAPQRQFLVAEAARLSRQLGLRVGPADVVRQAVDQLAKRRTA